MMKDMEFEMSVWTLLVYLYNVIKVQLSNHVILIVFEFYSKKAVISFLYIIWA